MDQFWVNSERTENTSVLPSGKFLQVNFYVHVELHPVQVSIAVLDFLLIGAEVWSLCEET